MSKIKLVTIPSSYDGKIQNAYFCRSSGEEKKPLIVSLHQWSYDYSYITDYSSLAEIIEKEDFNFIYPDFRGPNNSPDACFSQAVIHDIDDAIDYAIKNGNVDEQKIIVTGVSGGGMATLGTYVSSSHKLFLCMAWCPISDIEAWYYQSKFGDTKYWRDIMQVTNSSDFLNAEEARNRSPIYKLPAYNADNTLLELYTGINDGYTGSVPILQTILFYNKAARCLGAGDDDIVSDKDIISLLSRSVKDDECTEYIQDRKVLYKKSFRNISILIFNGSHEILPDYAFLRIKQICSTCSVK